MRFVLLDESGGAPTASGETMTPDKLSQIAASVTVQLDRDLSPEWGSNFTVRAGSSATDIQPGETVFALLPSLPGAAGDIAYHDSEGNGVPVCFDAITASDTIMGLGNSVSVAISHECCETAGDEGCNLWGDGGDGFEYARELCDAVESNSYMIQGVAVSDFVLKAFFVPGRKGPYSFCELSQQPGTLAAAPFSTAPGGYQIKRSAGTNETQATAFYLARSARSYGRQAKHAHPLSRQARRGVKVA